MTVINENILLDDRKRLRFIVLTAPLQYKKIKLFLKKKNILFIQNVIKCRHFAGDVKPIGGGVLATEGAGKNPWIKIIV